MKKKTTIKVEVEPINLYVDLEKWALMSDIDRDEYIEEHIKEKLYFTWIEEE